MSYPPLIPDSGWMIAYGSCMSSLLKAKSPLAGTLSRLLLVCSPPLGSLAHWDSGSLFEMQDGYSTDSLLPTDIPSASVAVARAALQDQNKYDGKPD
jgi:hypothetical protein